MTEEPEIRMVCGVDEREEQPMSANKAALDALNKWVPAYDEDGDLEIHASESFGACMAEHAETIRAALQRADEVDECLKNICRVYEKSADAELMYDYARQELQKHRRKS